MTSTNPTLDASQFISFAKVQMGGVSEQGTLANAFAVATEYVPSPQSYPNFWQVGCVFDSILDYFLALKEAGALTGGDRALMAQLVSQAVIGYQYGIVGLAAAWYDDWCWWGIASSKAFDPDYEDIFGDRLDFFQSTAMDLWGLVDAGDFATVADSISDAVWAQAARQQNGIQFSKATLSDRSELHSGTRNSWALIERGATAQGTPRQKKDYAYFTTQTAGMWAVPRFPGGCWQYDFSKTAFPNNDGPDWPNPNPENYTLGVSQVTLMPGLYLSFCCSLIAAAERKAAGNKPGGAWDRLQSAATYRQKADEVVAFLTSWIELPGPDSLSNAFSDGVLVHERTPTYARLDDGSYPALQGYDAGAYWGGDQGLIMGALKQYAQLTGAASAGNPDETAQPVLTAYPAALLRGVFYNMPATGLPWPAKDLPGAVGPYAAPSGSPIVGDDNDYGSGSGVFWRYVMRSCRVDPGFGVQARKDPHIVGTATTSGTHSNSWGNSLFQPFNTVAAAIGAWYLLK
jgi:hypothetical protein